MARRHIMESTFRLNLLNPQHAKINEVIKGLNPKIYKSKNQFLIEACEFYIDHYGEDDIPSKEEKRYEQFVTRDEIEKIKKEIEYSAMSEARKEVISLLGGALAGVKNSQPIVIANPQEDMEEQPEEDVMNDSDVAGLNEGKSLSKNGSPVTFLIEKSDYDYSLLFFINRIKGKVIIDYHKTNAPACQYRIIYQTELLWQVG